MSSKQRTSLSLSAEALEAAQARRIALGYESLSEYIEFLIREDAQRKGQHLVIRGGDGVRYEMIPPAPSAQVTSGDEPSDVALVSEPPFRLGDAPPASLGGSSRSVSG